MKTRQLGWILSAGAAVTRHADSGCSSCGAEDATAAYDTNGNIARLQNARGYITESDYSNNGRHLIKTITVMTPAGCDPATDANHCRLTADALSTTALSQTSASLTTNYTYGDSNWPDRPTQITRNSVLMPGNISSETFTFDPTTGETLTHTQQGFVDTAGTQESHITTTSLYGANEAAAFTAGGTFQTSWLSLPQPAGLKKSIDGPRTDVTDVTKFVYYPIDPTVPGAWRGQLAAVQDVLGHITHFADYDAFGHVATVTDANGVVTRYTFDTLGRTLTSTISGVAGCNTTVDPLCATDLTTTRTYAAGSGALVTEQRPFGNLTTYTYDSRGRLQTLTRGTATTPLEKIDYTYDPTSQKKASEIISAFQNNAWVTTKSETYTYTSDGHLSATIHADNSRQVFAYLPDGTLSSVQDENHNTPNTMYSYEPANRLSTVTQTLAGAPGGQITTSYGYDIQGNLTSVTDPNGNVTTYLFDDFGRMQRQVSPVSGTTTYTYDAAGNLLATTDANSATTTRTYDSLNRVLSSAATRSGITENVTWSYDDPTSGNFGVGRAATMNDPSGSTAYQYERRGMLRSEAKTIAGVPYTSSYTYDENGNRKTITHPSGIIAQYTSDFADRPYSLTTGSTTIVSTASYLPFGPLTSIAFGNGTTRTMQYDNRYRPLENKLIGPGGTIADYTYAEDNAGNITQLHDATNPNYNRDFGHDDLNRLTTANSGTSLWGAGTYTYDRMGNMLASALGTWKTTNGTLVGITPKLSSMTENGTPRNVIYDAVGNETAVGSSVYAYSPRNTLASADTASYVYDGRNVLTISTFTFMTSTISPGTVTGGAVATGTITLNAPAAVDTTITLVSSNSGAATVPPSVTISAGQTTGTFSVTTSPVDAGTTATLTASFNQYTATSLLTVLASQLSSVTVTPNPITGGTTGTGTVTLTGAAATTLTVTLTSSNTADATVPASVSIPAGTSTATFQVNTTSGVVSTTVTITATLNGTSQQTSLVFADAELASLSISPTSVINGGTTTGTVTLNANAASATTITLSTSSYPDAYCNPFQLTVPAGAANATFTIYTNLQSAMAKQVTFTATHGAVTRQATVTVNPPFLTSFTINPSTIVGGDLSVTQPIGTATINGPGSSNGTYSVTFTSSNTSLVATPRPITYPYTTSGQTAVFTNPVTTQTAVVVTATDPTGVNVSQTMTLQPAAVTLSALTLSTTSLVGSNFLTGTVALTAAAPAPGIDVELQSTNVAYAYPGSLVHVPTGSTSATFTIKTSSTATNQSVALSAIHSAIAKTAALTVKAYASGYAIMASLNNQMSCCQAAVTGGTIITGTVTLSTGNAARNTTVTLTSSNTSIASVPSSVTIPRGSASTNFTITTFSVTNAGDATITASAGGTLSMVRVIALPANGVALALAAFEGSSVTSGSTVTIDIGLTGPAPPGGATVTISGGSRANIIDIPATITVPAGTTTLSVNVQTHAFTGVNRASTLTATYGGITRSSSWLPVCDGQASCANDMIITAQPQASLARPEPVQCAALSLGPCLMARKAVPNTTGDTTGYYLYTPELQLMAETQISTNATKPVAYSYLWFGGIPVASIEASTNTTRWYFTDHLGTPVLQTDSTAAVVWRAEQAPYGAVYSFRNGATLHQPLRFVGQIAQDSGDISYNIFRWYRAGWGRYTQADPLSLYRSVWQPATISAQLYGYGGDNPLIAIDRTGLQSSQCCDCPERIWSYSGVSGGVGLGIGMTYSQGTYTCTSRPELQVRVRVTCIQRGFLAYVNFISYDTSAVPLGIPGAIACRASELTNPDPTRSATASSRYGVGVSGDVIGGTGLVSVGAGIGAGVGGQQCYANPW